MVDQAKEAIKPPKETTISDLIDQCSIHLMCYTTTDTDTVGLTDWFLIRKIQYSMRVLNIGALAFTKILGRLLLSLPNFLDTKKYLPPMPATFM